MTSCSKRIGRFIKSEEDARLDIEVKGLYLLSQTAVMKAVDGSGENTGPARKA